MTSYYKLEEDPDEKPSKFFTVLSSHILNKSFKNIKRMKQQELSTKNQPLQSLK